MGVNTRNHLCFALFWVKVVLAMFLSLGGLLYLVWRVADLHSRAVHPNASANLLDPINLIDPKTGVASASCAHDPSLGLARLEPDTGGKIMTGYSLDWSYDLPSRIVNKLNGYRPPVFNAFMQLDPLLGRSFNGLAFDNNTLNWFGSECGRTGSILELTLEPLAGIQGLTPAIYESVAVALADINRKYGVPVFLRYGHEMNGNWIAYGMQPLQFIDSFRAMTNAVRAHTNMTAMVWAPNAGLAYPFGGGIIDLNQLPAAEFAALDTSGNGVIDYLDDPYTPYYPGDEYVDWVGISLYYYPLAGCHNCPVPNTYFRDYLTGSGPVASLVAKEVTPAFTLVHNFYAMFSGDLVHKKPLMLPETGSPYVRVWADRPEAVSEAEIKAGWWNQVLTADTIRDYPKLKLMVNYEDNKMQDPLQENVQVQLATWLPIINRFKGSMIESSQLKYGCDGSVKVV
ncbi:glycoside hydrolase superfamily [Obelidium mucronatum]|nr:glycoside hydrolase superfamily [Obelidium mucronatum]